MVDKTKQDQQRAAEIFTQNALKQATVLGPVADMVRGFAENMGILPYSGPTKSMADQAVLDATAKAKAASNPFTQFFADQALSDASKAQAKVDKKIASTQQALTAGSPSQQIKAGRTLENLGVDLAPAQTPQEQTAGGFNFGNLFQAAAPQAASTAAVPGKDQSLETYRQATKAQESGGNYSAVSPKGALGAWQVMPQTAQAIAKRLGLPWNPQLMTDSSPAGQQYQDAIGNAATEEAWNYGQGNPALAAAYYHAGPDPKQHGPLTAQYTNDILARLGQGSTLQQMFLPDPSAANQIVGAPTLQAPVNLPAAPTLQGPAELPMRDLKDPSMLNELIAAIQGQGQYLPADAELAKKKTGNQAMQQGLLGLFLGAATGNPLLALAGGAGGYFNGKLQGKASELDLRQLAQDSGEKNALQAALEKLGLANENFQTSQINQDRTQLNQQGIIDTANKNALNLDQRAVDQVTLNSGIAGQNTNRLNDTQAQRQDIYSKLLGADYEYGNKQIAQENELRIAGQITGQTPEVNSILQSVGITPKRVAGEDKGVQLARQAAQYIVANNSTGVLDTLTDEIIDNGYATQILDGQALKDYNKFIADKDKAGARQMIAQLISNNPQAAKQIAAELSKQGLPVSSLITKYNTAQ